MCVLLLLVHVIRFFVGSVCSFLYCLWKWKNSEWKRCAAVHCVECRMKKRKKKQMRKGQTIGARYEREKEREKKKCAHFSVLLQVWASAAKMKVRKKSVLEKAFRHRNLKNKNEIAKDREDLISGVVEVCGKTVRTVCTAELGRTD